LCHGFAGTHEQELRFDNIPRLRFDGGRWLRVKLHPGTILRCKMKRAFSVFAVLVFASLATLAFSVTARAQFAGGLGTVEGTVFDGQGKAVTNASVTIQTSDGMHPHATHTDANGHFEFTRWDAGQYDLRAYSNGVFSDWAKRTVIRPKKTTEISLRLPAAQPAAK
jgi:Carboxypeptidase regulatory-like domain